MGLDPQLLNPSDLQRCEDVRSEAEQSIESELIPDQDILESIEDIYFSTDGNFDPSRYELEKLPGVLSSKEIEKCFKKLKQQHQVVSKKVLQLILDKQKACKVEFDRILLLQEQLQDILEICRIGRADLQLAKMQFTTASLGILANYQKRQTVEEVLNNLKTIKTLVSLILKPYAPYKFYAGSCITRLILRREKILFYLANVITCVVSNVRGTVCRSS